MRWTRVRRAAVRVAGLVCVGSFCLPGSARGAVLARYEFAGTDAPTLTGANVTASNFKYDRETILVGRNSSVGNPPGSFFTITRFATIGEAKLFEPYSTTTLTPAPGQALSLQSFRVDLSAYSVLTDAYAG